MTQHSILYRRCKKKLIHTNTRTKRSKNQKEVKILAYNLNYTWIYLELGFGKIERTDLGREIIDIGTTHAD